MNGGFYSAYLIKGLQISKYTSISAVKGNPQTGNIEEINEVSDSMNKFDIGMIAGTGLSYPINNQLKISIEGSMHLGLIEIDNKDLKNRNTSRYNRSYNLLIGCSYTLKNKKK